MRTAPKTLPAAVQIAGVHDLTEARMLIRLGVRMIGFPLRLPVHNEDITEAAAAQIIADFPPAVTPVLITYASSADEIQSLTNFLNLRTIQLHGSIPVPEIRKLKVARPDYYLIKSLVVRRNNLAELIQSVEKYSTEVDAFITDTFDPVTGAEGATGKTHDWNVSRKLVELSLRPVILAGGLTPENVREAILTVCPAGVDAHTGLEAPDGRKSSRLVRLFMENALRAFSEITPETRQSR